MMYDRIVTSVLGPVSLLMKFPFNQKKKKRKKKGFSNVSINGLKTLPCAYQKKKKKKKKIHCLVGNGVGLNSKIHGHGLCHVILMHSLLVYEMKYIMVYFS